MKMPPRKKTNGVSKTYLSLAVLRFALVFVPQTGYIHPDEYFQSVEVLAGKFLEVEVNTPWEFNVSFPIRSMALQYFTTGLTFRALKDLNNLAKEFLSMTILSPYILLIVPRLLMCCLSFIADFCLYKICRNNNEKAMSRLILLASSYVMIVFGTRTFSNTFELLLFAILLYYVCESLTFSNILIKRREYLNYRYDKSKDTVERVKFHKLRSYLTSDSLRNCFEITIVTVVGFFNRPTFLAYAVVPVFFWLYRGIGARSVKALMFHLRILVFILCSIPTFAAIIIIDSFYYGYLTWGEIGMLDISVDNFVFTPLNFLKYNIKPQNLAQHGLHPRYLHLLVNIPLLFHVLAGCALVKLSQYVHRIYYHKFHILPTVRSIRGLMTLTFLTPALLLSFFPHQEPRFLIPLIIPLIYLHGPTILPEVEDVVIKASASTITNVTPKVKIPTYKLLNLWLVINTVFAIFFGFIHQGGVYHVTDYLSKKAIQNPQTEFHVITSHIYTVPYSQLLQRSTSKIYTSGTSKYVLTRKVFLYEEGSKDLDLTFKKMRTILWSIENERRSKWSKTYKVYLVAPSSLSVIIHNVAIFEDIVLRKLDTFYPHISTEAFPDMTDYSLDILHQAKWNKHALSTSDYFKKFFHFCGLNIYEFSLNTFNSSLL